jgi:hypothetical protein
MKASDLIGAELDYWVARGVGKKVSRWGGEYTVDGQGDQYNPVRWSPSTDWAQGGPIIERFNIIVWPAEGELGELAHALGEMNAGDKTGWLDLGPHYDLVFLGPTKLIAAMRAFVRMQFGDELPDLLEPV